MREKTYIFSQPAQECEDKEAKKLYVKQNEAEREHQKQEFLDDFKSNIWMTYRCNFTGIKTLPGIPKEQQLTSDTGWGCMIRSGQMLIANCILRHMFRETKFSLKAMYENKEMKIKYLSLLWQ